MGKSGRCEKKNFTTKQCDDLYALYPSFLFLFPEEYQEKKII